MVGGDISQRATTGNHLLPVPELIICWLLSEIVYGRCFVGFVYVALALSVASYFCAPGDCAHTCSPVTPPYRVARHYLMVTAWKDRDYSSRYHQSILKGYNRQRSAVFLSGSRLSSRHIFHMHRYLKPFQIKIFFHLMSRYRIGTGANVPVKIPIKIGYWQLTT